MVGSINDHIVDMAQLNLFEGEVDQNTRTLSPKNKKKKTGSPGKKMSRTKDKTLELEGTATLSPRRESRIAPKSPKSPKSKGKRERERIVNVTIDGHTQLEEMNNNRRRRGSVELPDIASKNIRADKSNTIEKPMRGHKYM